MNKILIGDCRQWLKALKSNSVQCICTSPPYYGLRDYSIEPQIWDGAGGCDHDWQKIEIKDEGYTSRKKWQHGHSRISNPKGWQTTDLKHGAICNKCGAWVGSLGLEPSPELFIKHMIEIFREAYRVLRNDGTLWLNLGDSYASSGYSEGGHDFVSGGKKRLSELKGKKWSSRLKHGLKPKDLCMMPARIAIALQADGWYLRQEIIWSKPNPMPESVTDRCTKAHEYIYLLTKNQKYYYDQDAIREPAQDWGTRDRLNFRDGTEDPLLKHHGLKDCNNAKSGRNKRSVWEIPTAPYSKAHFATFPPALVTPCILAGSKRGDLVMDPFSGSGTVGAVAAEYGRQYLGIELNPFYAEMRKEERQVQTFL